MALHNTCIAEYAPGTFVRLLMNAAQAKDYVETISSLDKGFPNVDTLFCDYPSVPAGI